MFPLEARIFVIMHEPILADPPKLMIDMSKNPYYASSLVPLGASVRLLWMGLAFWTWAPNLPFAICHLPLHQLVLLTATGSLCSKSAVKAMNRWTCRTAIWTDQANKSLRRRRDLLSRQ